jgi:16S rRNA (guanine1516-N2)-methyltransferase
LPDSLIAVSAAQPELAQQAADLAAELGLPLIDACPDARALLTLSTDQLALEATGADAPGPIAVDFAAGSLRHRRRGGHNEPLGRAVGIHKWPGLSVVDATAGLGRDSFVLADLGCQVTLLEREPVIYALLRDGLRRGQSSEDAWVAEVCRRMSLERADARDWLAGQSVDVVYLDPMFPARRKSARVKKDMWLFQQLLEDSDSPVGLLDVALAAARRRVVVKRPSRAPALEEREPAFQLPGKTVRFDVYLGTGDS